MRDITTPTLHIDLLTNCCHSLQRGYELWEEGQDSNNGWLLKEAVFWIHHGIELALKQLLVQTNEFLVFSDVDKAVDKLAKLRRASPDKTVLDLFDEKDAPLSVGFKDLLPRCAIMLNLNELAENQVLQQSIEELTRYRNKIVHFSIRLDIGKVVRLLAEILTPLIRLLESRISEPFKTDCLPKIKQHVRNTEVLAQIFHLPYEPDPYFTGREEVFKSMQDKLSSHGCVFLRGAAGWGKTHTAIQYAYLQSREYKVVLWVEADSKYNFFNSIAGLTTALPVTKHTKSENQINAVRSWMRTNQDWLVIINNLDNATDLETVKSFIPLQQGHTLYTTRLHSELSEINVVSLPVLSIDEIAWYLLLRIQSPDLPKLSLTKAKASADWSVAFEIAQMLPNDPKQLKIFGDEVAENGLSHCLSDMKENI
ncbi:hypothetical protein QUF61_14810 [Candidatus Venteria ishoeyi]|uniref:hypothetical protein n=1 Tax=Candidatus Venteria ishoeyi TaxID=1899563 RepID=UPI0025A57E8A|nr:hypothetical protein [Candidatus Venteria ishoeyi]MDM8547760.1 hypothetical protein [Candidatus Venteria ishoeyi]